MSDKRNFTIESAEIKLPEDYQGRFESRTPGGAALKAARRLFAIAAKLRGAAKKKENIRFVLRETTIGSAKKEYNYIAMKRKLDAPVDITRGDVTITVTHEYKVKSCK
jgi:hypothetical protein